MPDSQKSFGLGIQWIVVRTLGECVFYVKPFSIPMWYCSPHEDATSLSNLFLLLPTGGIPGPIAFGSVIDISCILWQNQCGHQGSCYLYHNAAMSQYTLVAGIIYKVMLYILTQESGA